MKKTHIFAKDYEILVSGQGKTLDQVINNVSNNGSDNLIPITIVSVEEIAQYIYDTYQPSIVIPSLQKFQTLNQQLGINIELFSHEQTSLSNIIKTYKGFVDIELVKLLIINSLESDDFTWIFPFIISHNITTPVIFTINSSINMPESFIQPSDEPNTINIGQIKKGTAYSSSPINIISKYAYNNLSSDDFTSITGIIDLEKKELKEEYLMDNESKFIFKASIIIA